MIWVRSSSFAGLALLAALACTRGGERPDVEGLGGAAGAASSEDLSLPFALTEHYVPTGFMGDGVQGTALLLDAYCPLPVPSAAQGECLRFRYLRQESTLTGWAGLYFQSSPNNWGEAAGHAIEPGARGVAFYAAASHEVTVDFVVGGIGSASTAYRDEFETQATFVIGREFAAYEVPLDDIAYERVIGGFGFVIAKKDAPVDEVALYLDGVVWH